MSNYATCQAGAARVKITPDLPCFLAGYFHERPAERVRDDLYATAMVFENEGQRLALVACDLIAMTDKVNNAATAIIADEVGIAAENVLITTSHTHTGPEIREAYMPYKPDYVELLPGLIAAAVRQAAAAMFEATVNVGVGEAKELSYNRLQRLAGGGEVFGGRAPDGETIVGPAGPVDSSLQTLAIHDSERRLRGLVVNFACHPDVIGGGSADFVSADWPGEMCRNLMAVYGDDVPVLFLQGTAGDINQSNYLGSSFYAQGGPEKAQQMGRGLAGAALLAAERAKPLDELTLDSSLETLEMPFYTRTPEVMAYVAELKARIDNCSYFEKAFIKRVEAWPNDGKSDRFDIRCFRIGDVAIVGMPGEIFTSWGLETKRYSPARQTFFVELASAPNGMAGYKATTDQCLRGGDCKGAYGAIPVLSQRHRADAGRLMTESAIRQLHELF